MGLFSGSKKIYVSSSVYNLAGDELDRPNFLKSSLFSAVMNPYDSYLGEVIVGNYLSGPGIMQRSFFNWAVNNDIAGLPTLSVTKSTPVDPAVVVPFIPVPATPVGLETRIQSAEITDGDYIYWAERWLFENNPDALSTLWLADYNSSTHQITIQYQDGSTVLIDAGNFNKNKMYVIARYIQVVPASVEPLVIGTKTEGVYTTPDTTGYVLQPLENTGVVTYTLNQTQTVEKVYSDGSPTTTETTYPVTNVDYNTLLSTWYREDYVGSNSAGEDTSSIEKWLYIWERREIFADTTTSVVVNDLGNGQTETVTTTLMGDHIRPIFDHQEDTQETINDKIEGNNGVWIYEINSGIPTLDALVTLDSFGVTPEYYPFIPIRLKNDSIREPIFEDLYKESKKAYKRATGGPSKGGNLDTLIDEVEANEDIGDIDYSYIQWGVSVNVIDPACRRYMYEFFKNMIPYQQTSPATMTNYKNSLLNYQQMKADLDAWKSAQGNTSNPLYGTPKPPTPAIGDPESSTVQLVTDHPDLGGFDNRYTWVNISESIHTGVGKANAKPGDVWFETGETLNWLLEGGYVSSLGVVAQSINERNLDEMILYKQETDNTYTKLTIWGMVHENYIYEGKAVRITLKEGVEALEESPFLVPLHAPTVKSLGVKDFTQMALSNTFITFNCYQVVRKKWYQTFLGMLIIIIAVVVVAAILAPAAVGGAAGILGTNAAVGASLGLSGTAAIVAGAVTNAIAAIVIAKVINTASIAIFGEKWGAIIGAIVTFAVTMGMSGGFTGMSMMDMMTPQNLLKFSSALANGYSGFVNAENMEIQSEMAANQEAYDKAKSDMEDLLREMGLTNDLLFDPLSLTNTNRGNGSESSYTPESMDQFISRTNMTGSDIVDITLSMVTDYPDLQLTLPKD